LREQFGMNLIWFGVVTVVAVEVGLLTPPFGLSYVIKSTLGDPVDISLGDIFRGTAPFTLIMLVLLGLLGLQMVLLLPTAISLVLLK
jgi:C4-dicarboxylate transporter DctM subunit